MPLRKQKDIKNKKEILYGTTGVFHEGVVAMFSCFVYPSVSNALLRIKQQKQSQGHCSGDGGRCVQRRNTGTRMLLYCFCLFVFCLDTIVRK